jgi:hypothetical protein
LRALTFGYDDTGAPTTDPRLAPAPAGTLSSDIEPFVDWLDAAGERRADAHGAAFVRRWRITPLSADEPHTIAIEVCVFRAPAAGREPVHAEACLSTARVRQP